LLEFFLPTGVSPLQEPVRDLMGSGHPFREVFRATNVVAGAAFLLAGPPLVRLAPVHWTARLSAAAVAGLGLLVLLDAAYPMNPGIGQLSNSVFVLGAGSLVLWWPPGWRTVAAAGLACLVLAWLTTLALGSLGPDHFEGLVSRAQMMVRVALLGVGAAYLLRDSPIVIVTARNGDLGEQQRGSSTPNPLRMN
jgi:hypothetical protein